MFESSSTTRKSRNRRQMVWQWIPNTCRATDENDLEVAMVVLRGRTHMCKTKKSWVHKHWHISWDERWKIGWLLSLEHSESNRGNFETNSVANRKPMQIWENGSDVAEPMFLCDNSSDRVFWTRWRRVRFETDVPAQERVAEIKSGANYCCSYGFWRLNSERSPNVTEGANMELTSLACFGHLLIKGHFWVKVNTQILNWCLKLNWTASNLDCFNWLRQSSKRLGSPVVKDDGHWLGRVQMKTVIQEPVMYSLSAWFNWSNLSSQHWRVSTYIKLIVVSILMEGHRVILVWLIRIYDVCDCRYEKNNKQWNKNRALRHTCEYGGGRWRRRFNLTKDERSVRYERIHEIA